MENVVKSESYLTEGKDDQAVESKNETSHESSEINAANSMIRTEEFLKQESGSVDNENRSLEQNVNPDSVLHTELCSLTSGGLINAESKLIPDNHMTKDLPVPKNFEESKIELQAPAVNNSDVITVNTSNGLEELSSNENERLGKGDNLGVKDSFLSNITSEDQSKIKVTASELTGDHDMTLKKEENGDINIKNPRNENDFESSSEEPSGDTIRETPDEWMDILGSGHLMKKVLKPGIPNSRPQKSDVCILNLTGRLEDGSVVEQSENLKINLSDNEVIQGLDFALALMDKGEESEIKVSPRFGYGSLGKRPEIPPGANLVYTVTLLDVKEEPQIHTLNVMERIKNGLKKKERGNWWYSRDENTLAINCYRRALDYLDDTDIPEPHSEEDVRKLLEERLKTYNNLGAAQMKISAFDAALMSVNNVLTAQPENVKALFRKSKILKEKGELQESINVVKKALSFEPESQTLQQELSALIAAQRKVNSKQRELYKKMMGNSNNQSDEDKKKNSKNNYKTFTLVAAVSFAVAVLGTIVVKYKF